MSESASFLVADVSETAVDASRGERRHKQAGKTIRADLTGKAINITVRLVSIPLAAQLLGTERYGLWLTVSSILMWLNMSQFGLGGGLLNEIGKASAKDDRVLMRRHIATAYALFLGIGSAVFAVILGITHTPLAALILGVSKAPQLAQEARSVFMLSGGVLSASLLILSIGPVCMGLQEGYLVYSSFAMGSLLSLAGISIVYKLHGTMLAFAAVSGLPTVVTNLGLTAYVFLWRHPDLRPRFSDVNRASLTVLASLGGALGLVQLGELTVFHTASPMIADRLGLAMVPQFAVPFSIFMMVATICQGLTSAYQAAFCEASTRHDWRWIRSTFALARLRGLAVILAASSGLALAGPAVIRIWTRGRVTPDHLLLSVMVVYFVLMLLSMQHTILLVGLGRVGVRAILSIGVAAAHVVGFLTLARFLGVLALPVSGGAAYAIDFLVSRIVVQRNMQEASIRRAA